MFKKLILFSLLVITSVVHVYAEDTTIGGVFVWVDGSSKCYKLSDMPKVSYVEGAAVLTIGDSAIPELTLELKDDATLEITYGTYTESDGVTIGEVSKVERSGKYIRGGRLIIVKDGKLYDIKGIEIK